MINGQPIGLGEPDETPSFQQFSWSESPPGVFAYCEGPPISAPDLKPFIDIAYSLETHDRECHLVRSRVTHHAYFLSFELNECVGYVSPAMTAAQCLEMASALTSMANQLNGYPPA